MTTLLTENMKIRKHFLHRLLWVPFIFVFLLLSITGCSSGSGYKEEAHKQDPVDDAKSEVYTPKKLAEEDQTSALSDDDTEKDVPPQKVIEKAKELTDESFYSTINSDKVVLVDFWAVWCPPCRIQGPIIDELAREIGHKAAITKLNVDHYNDISTAYNVRNIPTIILFKNGEVVNRFVGVQQKDFLLHQIEQLL